MFVPVVLFCMFTDSTKCISHSPYRFPVQTEAQCEQIIYNYLTNFAKKNAKNLKPVDYVCYDFSKKKQFSS